MKNRVAAAGVALEPAGARLLAERCGTDVKRLRNDVERLLLYGLGQKTIGLADVREVVGPAALQDDWAMANAIEAGDAKAALRPGRADVRRRRSGREDPGTARMARSDEVRARQAADVGRRPVSGRIAI